MTAADRLHLNAAAGHLQLGDALAAWHELEMIAPRLSFSALGSPSAGSSDRTRLR